MIVQASIGGSGGGGSVSLPLNQIGYGTGSGITSSSALTFDGTTLYTNSNQNESVPIFTIENGVSPASFFISDVSPEGSVTATPGSLNLQCDTFGSLYVKTTGSGNTGWLQLLTTGSVTTSGIDDVLAVGQSLTTNRTITGTSQQLTFDLASWELITSGTTSIRANTTDVYLGGVDVGVFTHANENFFQVADQTLSAYFYVEPGANVAYIQAKQATILGKRFEIDGASGTVAIGDVQGANNGTKITIIDKTDEAITYNANLGHLFTGARFSVTGLQSFANNAAATGAGLVTGDFYRISVAGTSTVAVVE